MTYPLKFRKHVLEVQKAEGLTLKETSTRFYIGIASLVRWHTRLEPCMTRNKPTTKIDMQKLEEDVTSYPDAYQRERAARLGVIRHGIHCGLRRLGMSYKKNPSTTRKQMLLPEKGLRKK